MKGYLVLAQNSENVDYVQQAYALALSLHASQDTCLISLVTNDPVPDEYKTIFDKIIPIPGNDDAANSLWKVENRWKLYHVTPYDETIVFDTDMLVFKSFNSIWDTLSKYDVFFASNVLDFKSNQVVDYYNRKMFNENDLPNLYFGLHYFKKNKPALDFYNTLAFVVANWERVYFDIAPKSKQKWVSMDVSAAIAAKILGIDDSITHPTFDFRFTHMKANLQGIDPIPSAWTKVLDYYINSQGNLIVSNIQQTGIFHYVENNFLDSTIISALEEVYNGKRN
jgi:hypothetical protein